MLRRDKYSGHFGLAFVTL